MKTRVVLADDHRLLREGLRLLLGRADGVEVVGEADSGRRTVEVINEVHPDIVIMDVAMPDLNGVDATRRIKAEHPDVKVIGLSAYADQRYVLGMLKAGASGYILKGVTSDELMQAVATVQEGKYFLSSEITGIVIENWLPGQSPVAAARPILGDREREVLQLLAEGKSSKEMSTALHISAATVETHRRNIMSKLGIHSIAELTKYAIREGLTGL